MSTPNSDPATFISNPSGTGRILGVDPPDFGNPPQDPASQPYLFFAINANDVGDHNVDRTVFPEYGPRTPTSVLWIENEQAVELFVSNGGLVASDLIRVDYELRYCTFSDHAPDQGFVAGINHAMEEGGSSADSFARLDFVPAKGISRIRIEGLPTFDNFANIYLRARVRPLFSKPPNTWDFLRNPNVVEATWVRMRP